MCYGVGEVAHAGYDEGCYVAEPEGRGSGRWRGCRDLWVLCMLMGLVVRFSSWFDLRGGVFRAVLFNSDF